MDYSACPLYKLHSKKRLQSLLGISNRDYFKQDFIASKISPYIDKSGKPRLIEPPAADLKIIQKRIKTLLGKIEVPDNVFSGIKGRSYIGNAMIHIGSDRRYVYKIDITAFFPSISRDKVYAFYLNDLCCSPDVAKILTNLTTVDLAKADAKSRDEVFEFLLLQKKIKCTNHLISGAPTSQILSYLVNHNMFDEMQALSNHNNVRMSIYVDDITFSSECKISNRFKKAIINIATKYNYSISKKKVKGYTKAYPKLITGIIIDTDGKMTLKNSLREKIITEFRHLQNNPYDEKCQQRLRGLVTAARQVDPFSYPNIYKFVSMEKPPEE